MDQEKYIEHEVKIRVLKETTDSRFYQYQKSSDDRFSLMQKNIDERFANFEKRMDDKFAHVDARFAHVDYKINLLIGICIAAICIPFIKMGFGIMG